MNNIKKINYIKYFHLIVVLIILITSFSIYSLHIYKKNMEKLFFQDSIKTQEITYNSSIEKYRLITSYIFQKEINKPETLSLLKKILDSKDEDEKRYLKGTFYQNLFPIFEHLKEQGVRQFHFHTKDNKSFLRFTNATKFGDNLEKSRKSIKYVNETGNRISIFETGIFLSGFRNVFPLAYNGEKLGSVEISLTLKTMINALEKFDNRKEYLFILNKKILEAKIIEDQKFLYTTSRLSPNFLIEDSNNMLLNSPEHLSEQVDKLNKEIFYDSKIQKSLLEKKNISKIIKIENNTYNVVFSPLIGFENILEGYLVSYSIAKNIPDIISLFPIFVLLILFVMIILLVLLQILKNKSQELISEKNWFSSISNSLTEGIFITNFDAIITYVNPMACELLGYKENELIGQNAHYLFHFHEKNNYDHQEKCNLLKGLESDSVYKSEDEYFKIKNGTIIPVEISSKKIFSNQKNEVITIFRDLSIKKELETTTKLLKMALDSCSDSIIITDASTNIIWANPAFEKLTGFLISEVEGKKPKEFIKSDLQSKEFYKNLWDTILSKKPWKGELVNKKKDNSLYHEELSITPVLDSFNEIKYFIAIKQDITEKKNREKEIEYLAYNDFLTGLPNRKHFDDKFTQVLKSLKSQEKYIALLFLDLDKFKILNDTKGHDYGDELLKEVSKRLSKNIRSSDFVARLGGDEFVIILDLLPKDYKLAKEICEKISTKILENIREPFLLNDYTYCLSTSIGIYVFNNSFESMEEIIKKSDLALYEAKKNEGNRYFIYESE